MEAFRLAYHSPLQHDLSVDSYSRRNGLSVDYMNMFVTSRLSSVTPLGRCVFSVGPDGLTDDSRLPQLIIPLQFLHTSNVALMINGQCIDLLRNLRFDDDIEKVSSFTKLHPHVHLKIELPFLRTDNDYDCREISFSLTSKRNAAVDCKNIPLELLNEANDEGLSFPDGAYRLRKKLVTSHLNEKLNITEKVLSCLTQLQQGPPKTLRSDALDGGSWQIVSTSSQGH